VRREVERAVSAERTIIPFRIENVMPTGAMEYALASTHWLDATVDRRAAVQQHERRPGAGVFQ
jgi:hypothetical protein